MTTILKKNDFEKILSNYSIGRYASSKVSSKALENTVYFVRTNTGKYVLKIFEQTPKKDVIQQTTIQEYLFKKNNPVPKIFSTKDGENIYYYNKKPIQIQEFKEGKRVKLNKNLIKKYGKIIGKIDSDLKKLKINNLFPWGKEFEFKKIHIYESTKINLKKEHLLILKEIKKLNKRKLTKALVHGDLNLDNTLIHNNKINAVIDYGDSHNGFLVTDPMVFICDEIINTKINHKKIELFLKEYSQKITLTTEDKKALWLFAKLRCIYSMNWCNKMQKQKPTHRANKLFNEYYSKYKLIKENIR